MLMGCRRITLIVLDSVGIGELPDAKDYGDEGSNTLGNIAKVCGGINMPNLCALGLGKVEGVDYLDVPKDIIGCFGRMAEVSPGKDTITGHWEIAGIHLDRPFPVYPNGFPHEVIKEFEDRIGTKTLANYPASGTVIIEELGLEHMKTGYPIVYTSADSVFQIATHEDIVPVEKLYEYCSIAREMLTGNHNVGRVVARPFIGEPGSFVRTKNRKDYSVEPVADTILDKVKEKGMDVLAVGKIEDIFSGRGITEAIHTANNMQGVDETIAFLKRPFQGLIMTNLVDFDMLYGHRNNPEGYKKALEEFDMRLPEITSLMQDDDLLIITADHGCDPITPSTDHSREYVPLLVYGKNIRKDVNLGTRKTFSDLANTISDIFNIEHEFPGTSFLDLIEK